MSNYDSIIFDMDGTLVDWAEPIAKAWNAIFKKYGWDKTITAKDFTKYAGHTAAEIGEMAFPDVPGEESFKRIVIASEEEVEYIKMFANWSNTFIPDRKLLDKLSSRYRLFIVSNCMAGYIDAFYELYDCKKYFEGYLDNRFGHPKWDNIKEIIKRYKLNNPVYVGDTSMDQNACEKAGCPFVFASYGYGEVNEASIVGKIKKLDDLLAL